MAAMSLHCWEGTFLVVSSRGFSLVTVYGLLTMGTSLVALQASVVVVQRLSCPEAC